MTTPGYQFLKSIGWEWEETETAARIVAGMAQEKIDQLVQALKAALEHENHEDGKCGCGWTLKAREVLEAVERGEVVA